MKTLKNTFSRVNGDKLAQHFFASAAADAPKCLRSASPKNSRKGIFQSFAIFFLFVPFLVFSVHAQESTAFPDIRSPLLREAVEILRQKGVLNGYPDGSFKPDKEINRAEAVKMIFAVSEMAAGDQKDRPFPDVPPNTWYAKYLAMAKNKGIIRGYPDGHFRAQNSVNRVEFIKMALLAQPFYKSPPISDLALSQYEDLQEGAWYVPFVSYGLHLEFLDEVNRFHPAESMTRGDAAMIMARIQKYRDEHPGLLLSDTETCSTCMQGIDVSKEFPELAFHPLARFHQGRLYLDGEDNSNALLSKRNIINLISHYELQYLLRTTPPEEKIRTVETEYQDEYQRIVEIHNGLQSGWDFMTMVPDPKTNTFQEILVRGGKPLRECRETTCVLETFFVERYMQNMSVDDPPERRTRSLYLPDPTKPMAFNDYRQTKFAKMLLFDLIQDHEFRTARQKKISELR